jgi:hypothetical protein
LHQFTTTELPALIEPILLFLLLLLLRFSLMSFLGISLLLTSEFLVLML